MMGAATTPRNASLSETRATRPATMLARMKPTHARVTAWVDEQVHGTGFHARQLHARDAHAFFTSEVLQLGVSFNPGQYRLPVQGILSASPSAPLPPLPRTLSRTSDHHPVTTPCSHLDGLQAEDGVEGLAQGGVGEEPPDRRPGHTDGVAGEQGDGGSLGVLRCWV